MPSVGEISNRNRRELGRAERLFAARRFTDARAAFQALRPLIAGDDYELVSLRLAECEFGLRRFRVARDAVQPFIDRAPYQAEALFFYLSAIRALGTTTNTSGSRGASSRASARPRGRKNAQQPRQLLHHHRRRRAGGRSVSRAGGEVPPRASRRTGRVEDRMVGLQARSISGGHQGGSTKAAAGFPRSDYRPPPTSTGRPGRARRCEEPRWLRMPPLPDWCFTTYRNSYDGRLAETRVGDRAAALLSAQRPAQPAGDSGVPADPPHHPGRSAAPPSLELDHWRSTSWSYAETEVWGGSAVIEATHRAGPTYRLGDLRQGIAAMKRAYPHAPSPPIAGRPSRLRSSASSSHWTTGR